VSTRKKNAEGIVGLRDRGGPIMVEDKVRININEKNKKTRIKRHRTRSKNETQDANKRQR